MARPGVVVTSRADSPPRSAPTDVGMAFMVGATETGDNVKQVVSMSQYEAEFGDRSGFTDAYDAAEVYFREGGAKLTVSRTNGTSMMAASLPDVPDEDVPDGTVEEVLAWVGTDAARAEAAERVEDAKESPRTSLLAQLHGLEGSLQAVDAGVASALAALTKDFGPGQVFVPGALGQAADTHAALLAHAGANNRVALLDAPPDADAAALGTLGDSLRVDANARYGGLFAPSAVVPGITSADTRTVNYSAVEAGIIARNDAVYTSNVAAAGINGQSRFAIDVTGTFTDAEREDLNGRGVDIARLMFDGVRTYGYRTVADPEDGWGLLTASRLNMEIVAQAEVIGERYVFAQIDGRGVTISNFGAELSAMLVPFYDAGSLYGVSAHDAFYVDVGRAVNTEETIANGELHAVIGVRMSPFAEYVVIEIVKVATDLPLAVIA